MQVTLGRTAKAALKQSSAFSYSYILILANETKMHQNKYPVKHTSFVFSKTAKAT